jgi:hypothetical protein
MVESSTQTAFLTQDSLQAPGGFNYVEVYLARRGEADVVAADFYYYSSGERLSESLRRLLLDWAAREERPNRTTLEKMQAANADRLQAIMVALKVGRKKDAYAVYSTMPRELQKDRVIQMMAIAAAADVGQKEHLSILEDFRREHAGDPALDVVSLGYFLLTKNFKEATTCLDRIDKAVGGDLYLSLARSWPSRDMAARRESKWKRPSMHVQIIMMSCGSA